MFETCVILIGFITTIVSTNQSYLYDNLSKLETISYVNESSSSVVEAIFGKCLSPWNRFIVSTNDANDSFYEEIHRSESMSVASFGNVRKCSNGTYEIGKYLMPFYYEEVLYRYEWKAQGFVVTSSSSSSLEFFLEKLKISRWWNAAGYFVLVPSNAECEDAFDYLWIAWNYNLMSVIFLCREYDTSSVAYSYNPYGNSMPKSWSLVNEYNGERNHSWLLLKFTDFDGDRECGEIFFDKTMKIDGYPIRANGFPAGSPRLIVDSSRSGFDTFDGEDAQIFKLACDQMNATVRVVPFLDHNAVSYFDLNGSYTGLLADVFAGKVDVSVNSRFLKFMWQIGTSYPHTTTDFCLAVRAPLVSTQWLTLVSVFDPWSGVCILCMFLVTSCFFVYHRSFGYALLNCFRLVFAAGLTSLPNSTPARLFLAHLFLTVWFTSEVYKANMVSVMTSRSRDAGVESLEDLRDEGYAILGHERLGPYIENPLTRSLYRGEKFRSTECLSRLMSGERIGCLQYCAKLDLYASQYPDIRVLDTGSFFFHVVHVTRMDWPLLLRFNSVVQRLREAGFQYFWRIMDERNASFASRQENDIGTVIPDPGSILEFDDLTFVFIGFTVGLFASFFVFVCEIIIAKRSYSST